MNLNNIYSKKIISEKEIEKFYNENKELFKEKFISFKYMKLTPEILTKDKNYSEIFYQKIDQLENQILDGKTFDEITLENKKNVKNIEMVNIRKIKTDGNSIQDLNDDLFNKIFTISEKKTPQFINLKNNFYIVEVTNQKNLLLTLEDKNLKDTIKAQIDIMHKITENKKIIDSIKNKKFTKLNMTNMATENNLEIKIDNINGINDEKILSKDMVKKIYNHSENEIFLITDNIFKKNYLINIEKDIKPNKIGNKDIKKYINKANSDYASGVYKSYDKFINTKYKIDINEKVLERLKNSF